MYIFFICMHDLPLHDGYSIISSCCLVIIFFQLGIFLWESELFNLRVSTVVHVIEMSDFTSFKRAQSNKFLFSRKSVCFALNKWEKRKYTSKYHKKDNQFKRGWTFLAICSKFCVLAHDQHVFFYLISNLDLRLVLLFNIKNIFCLSPCCVRKFADVVNNFSGFSLILFTTLINCRVFCCYGQCLSFIEWIYGGD